VREVTNQFLSNTRLYSSVLSDRLKCASVLEEVSGKQLSQFSCLAVWFKVAIETDNTLLSNTRTVASGDVSDGL